MPFIRLSDNYIDHPKFTALSDGAFRLWHEAMAYCRKHQTDGLIPFGALRGFRYFTKSREKQLSTPSMPDAAPLWELVPKFGYKVHDYLFWNLSKDEETAENSAATGRMRRLRARRKAETEASHAAPCSGERSGEQGGERSPLVPDRIGTPLSALVLSERESERKPDRRSKRPIFTGQRFVVFEWQLDDLLRLLGAQAETFDLHEWFFTLDARTVASGLVVPQRDGGVWLQAQTLAEAQQRGLPVSSAEAPHLGKGTRNLVNALAALRETH